MNIAHLRKHWHHHAAALGISAAAITMIMGGSPAPTDGRTDVPAVYHPARLLQLAPDEKTATGKVLAVIHELYDGDYHIWLAPDPDSMQYLNGQNQYHGQPALVLEISPDCTSTPADAAAARSCPASPIQPPTVGDHISATGPWVFDRQHGWQELHPLTALTELQATTRPPGEGSD